MVRKYSADWWEWTKNELGYEAGRRSSRCGLSCTFLLLMHNNIIAYQDSICFSLKYNFLRESQGWRSAVKSDVNLHSFTFIS
jgi:hypothetical protein